ncbi:MAG: hypothetical protein HY713_01920 [candidate division NC10 bacterium]|nr:hypothetical protein [candidate division NC10 bacterium]
MSPPRDRPPDAASPTASIAALVDLLDRSKNRFTPEDRTAKHAALRALAGRSFRDRALLLGFHEALCFLRAYPDDPELLQMVEVALENFGPRVQAPKAGGSPDAPGPLDETGIARTAIYCPFSYSAARWLSSRFPGGAEIDWDDEAEERMGAILPFLIGLADEEALVEVGGSYRAWLTAAKGNDTRSDLRWILDRLEQSPIEARSRGALYEGRELRIRWRLQDTPASRTLAKLPVPRVFFHRGAMVRYRGPLSRRLPGPHIPVRRPASKEAEELLDASRAAVAVRYREIHGFNFADPADVVVADVGRGVQIAWFGLLPEHRLPLRAHYGYALLKNGVPIGYGDASLLFDWVEIAFNIFETFRPGESAFVFVRLLAFVYLHFRVRTFHLDRYQIGYNNEEAIASGAFWFYYKLGFRPKRPDLLRLSADERRLIARDPTYRSSRKTLAQLCQGGMVVSVGGGGDPDSRTFDVQRLGLRALAQAGRNPAGKIATGVAESLGTARWRAWPCGERRAFERMAPVLALIPDLPDWSLSDRRRLVEIIRAKAGPREADYLRRMRTHARLRDCLMRAGVPETP